MADKLEFYYLSNTHNYLIEYKGNFKEQIDKVDYAVGDIITASLAVISVEPRNLDRLLKDVPAIIYVDFRSLFVLQDISPTNIDNINPIKINPYLNLAGKGVVVGIVDSGIDYINQEFMREDDTSRIISLWDQSIPSTEATTEYMGTIYSNEQINAAINLQRNNGDPYTIVPSKDEIGHGTKVASIIGARGYSPDVKGIAHDCDFVVVKLFECPTYRELLESNRVPYVPVYNNSEVLAALEYLKKVFIQIKRPMIVCLGVGSTLGPHDGSMLIARYYTLLATTRGLCLLAGVGNEGAAQGHASGVISSKGDRKTSSLNIPREINSLSFNVWVQKPNRASIEVISPDGETSKVIEAKKDKIENYRFVLTNTQMTVKYHDIESFTGHQCIELSFRNIKEGVWRLVLVGQYIIGGRYDIWLPPHSTLPEDTVFLEPDPLNTLTIPSTAPNVVTVAYYGNNNALIAASGKGYNTDGLVTTDIATLGTNIITTNIGGGVTTFSGSSAATAVVAGACALILEWAIVKGNDPTMYSKKLITYLMFGAYRNPIYKFPNRETGYGDLDLLGTFNIISRSYRTLRKELLENDADYVQYKVNKLFIRIPRSVL